MFHLPAYHHSHHRDNVVAPHGRPNLRSRLHYRHNREGNHESSSEHVVALGGKKCHEIGIIGKNVLKFHCIAKSNTQIVDTILSRLSLAQTDINCSVTHVLDTGNVNSCVITSSVSLSISNNLTRNNYDTFTVHRYFSYHYACRIFVLISDLLL